LYLAHSKQVLYDRSVETPNTTDSTLPYTQRFKEGNAESVQLYRALNNKNAICIQVDVPVGDEDRWLKHSLFTSSASSKQQLAIPSLHLLHIPSFLGEVANGNAQPYPGQLVNQPSSIDKTSIVATIIPPFDDQAIDQLLQQYNVKQNTRKERNGIVKQ